MLYGRADGSTQPWQIGDGGAPVARQQAHGRIVLGQAESQVAAVVAGMGLAQLPTWLVAPQIRDGSLIKLLPRLTTRGLPLHLLWQRNREHAPKIQALVAHFAEALDIRAGAELASQEHRP